MTVARDQHVAADEGSPALGIAYMCAGVFCLTVNDALAKRLGVQYSIGEIVFFRMLLTLPVIAAAGIIVGGPRALVTASPLFHISRGMLAAGAVFTFFFGLKLLPLSDNTAIAFASPLFITLLAGPLVGERPGARQWIATLTGFAGVLLVVRPGAETFTAGALLPLAAALSYALLMLSARRLGHRDTIWVTMLYATLVPLALSAALLPWMWRTPHWAQVPYFVAIGLFGGTAVTFITQAFRVGVASVVAPFDYTGLLWATAFGWLFWGELPSRVSVAGIIIIIACGTYLAYRQDRDRKSRTAQKFLHPPRGE